MGKVLYIAEKPSVAQEFAKALKINGQRKDGYLESQDSIVTWCVGHLVTMSYPEKYDIKYKRWSFDTLPFLPREFKYEVIPGVQKQFDIVKGLLNRPDVEIIYVCTDSGREGEYIYRLVAQMAGVKDKKQRRVWIDSQTEEEILRGIREAKDLSMTIWRILPTSAPRRTISWGLIFPECSHCATETAFRATLRANIRRSR